MKRVIKTLPFLELFKKFIHNTEKGKRLQPNGKLISTGTIRNYKNAYRLLVEFSKTKQFELRVKPVRHLNERSLIVEKNYWKRFYRKFTDFLYKDYGHFDNYVGNNIKILKSFFNYLNNELLLGIGEFHKCFFVRKEDIPIVTLFPEELNYLIHEKSFEETLSPRLRKIKDVFVFGCTVAQRVSDLLDLKKANLRIINNEKWYLAMKSKKQKVETQILLPGYAREILRKYWKKQRSLLPHFWEPSLNKGIKELIERAGFVDLVGKRREIRGRTVELLKEKEGRKATYRFCDLVSTHTMRRTGITTMLCLGVPEGVVRKISGHSPASKEFYRYVNIAQAYQDKELSRMFNILSQKMFAGTES